MKKSKKHLADAARKAALGAASDANGNQKQLQLELGDPLSYWIIQVWTFDELASFEWVSKTNYYLLSYLFVNFNVLGFL